LVRDIKTNVPKWVYKNNFIKTQFKWQNGFSAFTVRKSGVKHFTKYNKEKNHSKKSFNEVYKEFLNAYKINFKKEYLFDEN